MGAEGSSKQESSAGRRSREGDLVKLRMAAGPGPNKHQMYGVS